MSSCSISLTRSQEAPRPAETSILDLPNDNLLSIFHKLGSNDLLSLTRVCKRFRISANIALQNRINFWNTIAFSKYRLDDVGPGKELTKEVARALLRYEKEYYPAPLDIERGIEEIRGRRKVAGLEVPAHIIDRMRKLSDFEQTIKEAEGILKGRRWLIGASLSFPIIYPLLAVASPFITISAAGYLTVMSARSQPTVRKKIADVAKGVVGGLIGAALSPVIALAYPVPFVIRNLQVKTKFYQYRNTHISIQEYLRQARNERSQLREIEKDMLISVGVIAFELDNKMRLSSEEEEKNAVQSAWDEVVLFYKRLYDVSPPMKQDLSLRT